MRFRILIALGGGLCVLAIGGFLYKFLPLFSISDEYLMLRVISSNDGQIEMEPEYPDLFERSIPYPTTVAVQIENKTKDVCELSFVGPQGKPVSVFIDPSTKTEKQSSIQYPNEPPLFLNPNDGSFFAGAFLDESYGSGTYQLSLCGEPTEFNLQFEKRKSIFYYLTHIVPSV